MLRILQTFDSHSINDGTNYQAVILNPYSNPPAQTVFVAQANADSEDAGTYTVEANTVAISIRIKNYTNRQALIAQLQQWFKRGTAGELVTTFTDDGLDYYKPCRVVNLVQDPQHSLAFIATLNTGWTTWRAVDPDTYNWALSGTGGNHTVDLDGDDETPLSVTFTLSAGPASGYLYQRLYQLLPVAGIPAMGLGPWCITLDTAALIADNANKCQINQGGGINASVTTIPYDTVTGSIPSAGRGYVDSEQIAWTGKTGTTSGNLTGVTRGLSGTTAASHADNAEIKVSYIQANCADVRVFVDSLEVKRWIPNPNNASTKIWINLNLTRPGYSLALGTAITHTNDITEIVFAATPNVYAAIAALPAEGILVHGTEWIKYQRTQIGPTVRTLTVIQRGVMGTTKQTHAAGDLFQFMEHVVAVCYGNTVVVSPDTLDSNYNKSKPLFVLGSSTNAAWVYDATCDLFLDIYSTGRAGGFSRQIISRRGPLSNCYEWKEFIRDGDPALGMVITNYGQLGTYAVEQAKLAWMFYRACGIDTTTFTGQKYRTSTIWPGTAALQNSFDGSIYANIWNEGSPGSPSSWTALGSHSGDDIGDARWIRFLFEGSLSTGNVLARFEILTGTINFVSANLPSGTLLSQAENAQLELTLTNGANADAFAVNVPMKIGLDLALDADERTILFHHTNAHDGIIMNDDARDWWIRLQTGNNQLTVAATDLGTLTAALSWRRRRF